MILVSIFLLYGAIRTQVRERIDDICRACRLGIFFLYVITEVLSLFDMVNQIYLTIAWSLLIVTLFCVNILRYHKVWNKKSKKELIRRPEMPFLFLFAVFSIGMLTLAIWTVPYNWDSMCYHLPRIMHWAQNGSVAHYVTNDLRTITSPPLTEFVGLHIYLLYGHNDALFNLIQCFSYVLNAVLIYGITRKIGVTGKLSYLSSFLYLCMPIAFAEALSTQVDEFATVWLLIFVYLLLDFILNIDMLKWERSSVERLLLLGCSMGLGYLAIPSVLLAMGVFLIWLLIICILRRDSCKTVLSMALTVAAVTLVVIFPEIYRNLVTFHAISAPVAGARQMVGTFNPAYVFVNGIKNIAYNLSNIYILNSQNAIQWLVSECAGFLRVEIDNPAIAEDGVAYALRLPQNYNHDSATNFVLTIAAIGCALYLIYKAIRKRKKNNIDIYMYTSGISLLLFCFLARWEPYVTRYMLAYFALICPGVAGEIQNMGKIRKKVAIVFATIVCFMSTVDLMGLIIYHGGICMEQAADAKRSDGYFYYNSGISGDYDELISYLNNRKANGIGLYIRGNQYEYPIWSMLTYRTRMEDVLTENDSLIYDDATFLPEYIVSISVGDNATLQYHGVQYLKCTSFGNDIDVFTASK